MSNKRPSFIDISSDDEEGYGAVNTPSPDGDYVPSTMSTPGSANNTTITPGPDNITNDEDELMRYNQEHMDLDEYGMTVVDTQSGGDDSAVRRSRRIRNNQDQPPPPLRRISQNIDDDGDGDDYEFNDAISLGSDSDYSDDEDAESFYQKHPEMRNFVVDDDEIEDGSYSYPDSEDEEDTESTTREDFTYTMEDTGASRLPRATEAELKRLLKPLRCKKIDENTTCAVCVEKMRCRQVYVVLPACQHRFHLKCVKPWLLDHNRLCPTCRKDIAASSIP